MSDLRAPDPTLDAIEPDALIGLDYSEGEPLIGHTVRWIKEQGHVPDCAEPEFGGLEAIEANHARWFAVPCRVCFADAPAPGNREQPLGASPFLAWQVAP